MPMKPTNPEPRFWAKVKKTETCWLWQGALNRGYGSIGINGKHVPVHRYSYELHKGPIPPGLVIDHVLSWGCTNKNCVNPDHLEAVTHRENMVVRTNQGPGAINSRKTHCIHGHELTDDNTAIKKDGSRLCRTCSREWAKNRHYNNPKYREEQRARMRARYHQLKALAQLPKEAE